jgi:FAT domain
MSTRLTLCVLCVLCAAAYEGKAKASLGPGSATVEPQVVEAKQAFMKTLWARRLKGVQRNVDVWQSLFSVHSLVVDMHDDVGPWLKYSSLCRKSGRMRQSLRILKQLLTYNPMEVSVPHALAVSDCVSIDTFLM